MITNDFSAATGRQDFLQLLVTQLQHQDPLSPVEQEEFLQQLAQFSTLEQMENLNANFDQLLRLNELTQGAELLGRQVAYHHPGHDSPQFGVVNSVRADGEIQLIVDGEAVSLSDVIELSR